MREKEEMEVECKERVDDEESVKRDPPSVCEGNALLTVVVE